MREWAKFDLALPEHPKILAAGPAASWAFVCAIAYAGRNLTDGFVPAATVPEDVAGVLLGVGLFESAPGGYLIHDYLEHQRSKADVLELRETRKAAGALGGKASSRAKDKQVLKQVLKQNPSKPQAEQEQEQEKDQELRAGAPSLPPRVAAAFATLAAVGKPGYGESKFTQARFAALAAKHPTADLLDEAEKLADWECYGNGEKRQVKDGIAAFGNWLTKAKAPEPAPAPVPDTYDNGTYHRLTPEEAGFHLRAVESA